jgi:hypothetical protein
VPEPTPPRQAQSLEAKGIIVVAVLVLVILIVRYWHQIPWSAR